MRNTIRYQDLDIEPLYEREFENGRSFYLGKLKTRHPDYRDETHALRIVTPTQDVTFLLNYTDAAYFGLVAYVLNGQQPVNSKYSGLQLSSFQIKNRPSPIQDNKPENCDCEVYCNVIYDDNVCLGQSTDVRQLLGNQIVDTYIPFPEKCPQDGSCKEVRIMSIEEYKKMRDKENN